MLYKYYPDSNYSFKSLSAQGLWCHYPSNMNDPFECLGNVQRSFSKKSLKEFKAYMLNCKVKELRFLANKNDSDLTDKINGLRHAIVSRYAFCALSESYDDILMWSIYAAEHKGFVMGFDFKRINKEAGFQKVKYISRLEEFDLMSFAKFLEKDEKYFYYMVQDISVKSLKWKYEREWRIWINEPAYFKYDASEVKEIYFGINCNPDTKNLVANLTSYLGKNFKYNEMKFHDDPIRLVT